MKRIMFFIGIMIVLILSCIDVFSDCISCTETDPSGYNCQDWSDAPAEYPKDVLFGNVNGCDYEIYYKKRICINSSYPYDTMYSLKIDRIELVPCPDCSGSEIDGDIIQQATEILLVWARGIFGFTTAYSYTINIGIKSCIEIIEESNPTRYVYDFGECDECCCYMNYQLISQNSITSVIWKENSVESTCENIGPGSDCEIVCDELDSVDLGPIPFYHPPSCLSDVCQTNWTNTNDPMYIPGSIGSCNYTIFYEQCEMEDELALRMVKIVLGTEYSCNSYDVDEIFQDALKTLLADRAEEYDYDLYLDDYIFQSQSCWDRFDRLLVPSNDNQCCSSTYTIIWDNLLHKAIITDIDHNDPQASCTSPCGDICYAQDNIEGSIPTMDVKTDFVNYDIKCYIKPNPATGETELHFISKLTGNIEFKVFNSLGNSIINLSKNKGSVEEIFKFDVKKLADGIYYYHILLDNQIVYSDKFIINK